jgi:hypothetical protein
MKDSFLMRSLAHPASFAFLQFLVSQTLILDYDHKFSPFKNREMLEVWLK